MALQGEQKLGVKESCQDVLGDWDIYESQLKGTGQARCVCKHCGDSLQVGIPFLAAVCSNHLMQNHEKEFVALREAAKKRIAERNEKRKRVREEQAERRRRAIAKWMENWDEEEAKEPRARGGRATRWLARHKARCQARVQAEAAHPKPDPAPEGPDDMDMDLDLDLDPAPAAPEGADQPNPEPGPEGADQPNPEPEGADQPNPEPEGADQPNPEADQPNPEEGPVQFYIQCEKDWEELQKQEMKW